MSSTKASTRGGADSQGQADIANIQQSASRKISLAQLDRNSAAAYGQSAFDIGGGSGSAIPRADPVLSAMPSSTPARRSLSGFADAQDRVLEAFSRDTRPGVALPIPSGGLLESLQFADAALGSEEDIAASQRLAERFAHQPVQVPRPPLRAQAPSVRPYIVAAAFMILATAGSAFYFLGSSGVSKRAPEGTVRAPGGIATAAAIAPSAEEPLDSPDERNGRQARAFVPPQPVVEQSVSAEQQSEGQAAPAAPALPAVSPAEEEALLKRGAILLKNGDVSGARLNFENLALRGSAKGAFALAQSFDPAVLRSIAIAGLRPDLTKAKEWYAKAATLGDEEAARRLSVLKSAW